MTKAFLREDYQKISKGFERDDLSYAGSLAYPESPFRNPEMCPGRIQKPTLVYSECCGAENISYGSGPILCLRYLENYLFLTRVQVPYFKYFFTQIDACFTLTGLKLKQFTKLLQQP
jgi:hypothetical protein